MSKHVNRKKEKFTIVLSSAGIPISEISVDRNDVDLIADAPNTEILLKKITKIKSSPKKILNAKVVKERTLEFDWSISPYYSLHLFDPNRPIYYDIGAETGFYFRLKPGLVFMSSFETSIFTTFNDVWRGEKGNLPKVRSPVKTLFK